MAKQNNGIAFLNDIIKWSRNNFCAFCGILLLTSIFAPFVPAVGFLTALLLLIIVVYELVIKK
ncbi:MAG: hypothetical protein LBR41_03420 [Rickettsiales bacterium]|nr:hypothetical protein [Rickettsiales bacterium]